MIAVKEGWFEENEDGTKDYIAILENGEKWHLINVYLTNMNFGNLEYSSSDDVTIVMSTKKYEAI